MDRRWPARSAFLFWTLWCAVYVAAVLRFAGISKIYPGDELRFIESSRLFAGGVTLELLRTYPEMSGPLPFFLFSLWGRMFGWSLAEMRTVAVLIGFCTLLLLFEWLREVLGSHSLAFLTALLLCVNPYVAAMSVFVYTDMISVLFVLCALLAVERTHPVLLAVALGAALLSRQYLIFVAVGLGLHFLRERNFKILTAVVTAALPLAWFVWLWHGLAPNSLLRTRYPDPGIEFHLSAFVGYTGLLATFLAPLLMLRWRSYVPRMRTGLVILGVSVLAFVFPVRPSPSAVEVGLATVGLLDRGLHRLLSNTALPLFYWLAFVLGLMITVVLLQDAVRRSLPAILVVTFLFVMPLSYLYWEKYFLPVLPVAAVAMLRKGHWYPESI